jgi:acetyl esterase/lipase
MATRWYKSGNKTDTALVWAHGGCFTDGTERWDKELLENLSATADVDAVACNYRQGPDHPWPQGLDDLAALYKTLQQTYARVYVGGTSSGGFFAYALACRIRAPRCLLLCPVLVPAARHTTVKEYKRVNQLKYFGDSLQLMEAITDKHLRAAPAAPDVLVLRGACDPDAGEDVAYPRWIVNAREHVVEGATHRLCVEQPTEALREMTRYLEQR